MESRRITIRTSPDILWSGKSTKETFMIREVYYLTIQQEHDENAPVWKQIWQRNWWLKVTLFLWLVGKGRILTWD